MRRVRHDNAGARVTHTERLIRMLAGGRVMRSGDLTAAGVPNTVTCRAAERGLIDRIEDVATGISIGYALPGLATDPVLVRLAATAQRHERAVLCFWSALRLHELTDETEEKYTAAVRPGLSRHATLPWVQLIQWPDENLFRVGIEERTILGQKVLVTDPARTVLDCFRVARFPSGDAHKALRELVLRDDGGDRAVSAVSAYARHLNCYEAVEQVLVTIRSFQCATPMR